MDINWAETQLGATDVAWWLDLIEAKPGSVDYMTGKFVEWAVKKELTVFGTSAQRCPGTPRLVVRRNPPNYEYSIFLTFQSASGRLSRAQRRVHAQFKAKGLEVHVVKSVKEAQAKVSKLLPSPNRQAAE